MRSLLGQIGAFELRLRESLTKYLSPEGGGLRVLGADTVLYGGSRALAAAFALLTFPLVARILTPEDLGQFAIVQMLSLLLVPVAAMGQDMSVMKFLSADREDSSDADVNTTSLSIQLFGVFVSVLVACTVALAFETWVTQTLGLRLFAVAMVGIPAGVLFSSVLNLSKFKVLRGVFLSVSVSQVVLYTVFLIGSVIVFRYGVYGYALSTAGSLLVAAVVGLYLMRTQFFGGRILRKLARSMLSFGAPYVMVGLLAVLLPFMDRLVLSWRASVAEIGVYSVAIRYVGLLELALIGFKMAWWPFAFSSYSNSGDTGLFGRALTAYIVGAGCLVICLYNLSESGIDLLAGEAYESALVYVLPLLLAGLLRGFQVAVGVGIAISGRSFWAPAGFLAGVVVGLVVILALWPAFGLVSAAWGIFAGDLTALVVTAVVSQRFLPLRWQFGKAMGLASILFAYLGLAATGAIPAGVISTLLFLLAYCMIGWYTLRDSGSTGP
jgi:O-antigen/teichoic acid export membrane protein